jgi:hypothetical protein
VPNRSESAITASRYFASISLGLGLGSDDLKEKEKENNPISESGSDEPSEAALRRSLVAGKDIMCASQLGVG